MSITQYLLLNAPIIFACCYGLGLAFKNWPVHSGAGKLVIVALLIKLMLIGWGTLQWWFVVRSLGGRNVSSSDLVALSQLAQASIEGVFLALLAAAVFYGRPGAAAWPLRSR